MVGKSELLTKLKFIPDIAAEILAARGLTPDEIEKFLYPDYAADLHDPFLLSDMSIAVERITLAVGRRERVVVYGDYDIDGITASAVLIEALTALGLEVTSYIPDRFEEGYGINLTALESLKIQGAQLVISVDCGITSVDEAEWAKSHGLDLIITDHHSPAPQLPGALAVINPKREGDAYPFKDLAGVGVAFKLVQALQISLGIPAAGQEKWMLDLVALGTICDVVPLVGENRALASFGLKVLQRTRRLGLRALAGVGKVEIEDITAYEVGFVLGPRMNAAGRLEHASRSLELVLTKDPQRAEIIATELEELNRQRRSDQETILLQANEMAQEFADDNVLVLAHPDWSHGVVGIVASKLAEKWRRPVLLAQVLDVHIKGSARSVAGFNMVEALRSQAHLLSKFGGHYFAAGYSFAPENLSALRHGLNNYFAANMVTGREEPTQKPAEICWNNCEKIDPVLMEGLQLLEPHGNSNPRPVVCLEGLKVERVRRVGNNSQHLSLKLVDNLSRPIGAIGFGLAERYPDITEGVLITAQGTLTKNKFQGRTNIQMVLSDITHE